MAIRNRGYTDEIPPGTPTPEASYGSPPGALDALMAALTACVGYSINPRRWTLLV